MSDLRPAGHEEEEPTEPLLASFPVGSDQDRAMREALKKIRDSFAGDPIEGEINQALAGGKGLQDLMKSGRFGEFMDGVGAGMRKEYDDADDEERARIDRHLRGEEA